MLGAPALCPAQYRADRTSADGVEIVRLEDTARRIEVSIAPKLGNLAYEMKVNGKNLFWMPFQSVGELAKRPRGVGNPFLSPWANRLDNWWFWANGKKYNLDREFGNVGTDQNKNPLHGVGLIPYWDVVSVRANRDAAEATSRLEFWRHPDLMAQFPFAHTVEITYRLAGGALEVDTLIRNHATEPLPVAIGFHPYFRVHDAPRDEWKIRLSAREHMLLSDKLIPTGETKPLGFPDPLPLKGVALDDVFTNLVRDDQGRAEFWVHGVNERVSVVFGPKYQVAVVFAPPGRGFICFEPMAAPTNAFNAAQAGAYKDLQSIPPGGEWKESFWIRASGF